MSPIGSPSDTGAGNSEYEERFKLLLAGNSAEGVILIYARPIYSKAAKEVEAEFAPKEQEILAELKKDRPGSVAEQVDLARLRSWRDMKKQELDRAKREAIDLGCEEAITNMVLRTGAESGFAAYVTLKLMDAKKNVGINSLT